MNETEILYQVCAVPFRRRDDSLEFCLVTSTRTKEWSLPKGTIKDGTAVEIALAKANKEVGLHGRIVAELGSYRYRKWEMTLEVTALLMQVESCDDSWEDSDKRERCWVDLAEAQNLLTRRELKTLLETAQAKAEQQ